MPLRKSVRLRLARSLLKLLHWLDGDTEGKTERVERMTEALLARLGVPIPKGSAGPCPLCSRRVRFLMANAANVRDKRCIQCSPPDWLELYCSNVELALLSTATKAN